MTQKRKPYRRTRNRPEVIEKFQSLGTHIPKEIKGVFQWMLRNTDEFPDLTKTINYQLPIDRVTTTGGSSEKSDVKPEATDIIVTEKDQSSETTEVSEVSKRLSEVLSPNGHDHSYRHLVNITQPESHQPLPTQEELKQSFLQNKYFMGDDEIFAIWQALNSAQPIIVDGPPGTGKTELATQIALALGLNPENKDHFGKLYCTPDLTKDESIYSWNHAKRLMDQQLIKDLSARLGFGDLLDVYKKVSNDTYSKRYLDIQTLLRHCIIPFRTVVLIDEVDKTYPEYDSYLLDILINNNFEIPEYGPLGRPDRKDGENPINRPIFVLTTNGTRPLSGPLARRCKPIWCNYLPENLETKVVQAKCDVSELDAGRIAQFFHKIRTLEKLHWRQPPSTAEVIETVTSIKQTETDVAFSAPTIFKYHCHWIKDRTDFDEARKVFCKDGEWKEHI
jgi:MoxR-like ATPase